MDDIRRGKLHADLERLRGCAEKNRRRILGAYDRQTTVPTTGGRGYDDDRITGGQPGNPVLAFAQATQQTRIQVALQVARIVGDLGDSLTVVGHRLPATHEHLNRLAAMGPQDAPEASRRQIAGMLAIHAGWFQLLTDTVLAFCDDPYATDQDVQIAKSRAHAHEHDLHRCANRCSRLLTLPDHPKAEKQQILRCRCGPGCCPRGCGDRVVAQQDRKVHSDRCRRRMLRSDAHA